MGCIFWAKSGIWGDLKPWLNGDERAELDHLSWWKKFNHTTINRRVPHPSTNRPRDGKTALFAAKNYNRGNI